MFARPLHQTPDMIAQHELLNQAARLIDQGRLRTTLPLRSTPPTCGARTPSSKAGAPRARWCWKAFDGRGRRRAAACGFLAAGISYYCAETVKTAFARCPTAAARSPENSPARPHARPGPGAQPLGHGRLDPAVASFRPAARLAGRARGRHHVGPDPGHHPVPGRSPRLWDALVCGSVLAALLVAALLESLYALFRRYRDGKTRS